MDLIDVSTIISGLFTSKLCYCSFLRLDSAMIKKAVAGSGQTGLQGWHELVTEGQP